MFTSTQASGPAIAPDKRECPDISVVGAGVAGTWQALLFAQAGCRVTLYERGAGDMLGATSFWAGGMLAPDCEAEVAEPVVSRLGHRSLALWREALPSTQFNGSLVVAHSRDRADFDRFARVTGGHQRVDADGIATLEPALAGRFRDGLLYPAEGHVEPRRVLPALYQRLRQLDADVRFGSEVEPADLPGIVIDCRGLAARADGMPLRGVKGEVVIVETPEIALNRPVRLLHPRWPLYVIPREDNVFLIGATTIENEDDRVSVRSALELLSALYALHPAFGEARILEIGAGLRPAFADHDPRITVEGRIIRVNGLYRHGFLLAPALAELTVAHVLDGATDADVMCGDVAPHEQTMAGRRPDTRPKAECD